jgi:hypothetical protein
VKRPKGVVDHSSVCYSGYIEIILSLFAALLVGSYRDRFPVVPLDFSVTYSFRPLHGPGVDAASSEYEYQEHFLEVKSAGA